MSQAGFEPEQNLSSGFVELSCAEVMTTTPQCQIPEKIALVTTQLCTKSKLCISSNLW